MESEEIRQRRKEIKYWIEIYGINRDKVEGIYSKKEKFWNLINEQLQVLVFPTFGGFENFKEQTETIAQVENSITQD